MNPRKYEKVVFQTLSKNSCNGVDWELRAVICLDFCNPKIPTNWVLLLRQLKELQAKLWVKADAQATGVDQIKMYENME